MPPPREDVDQSLALSSFLTCYFHKAELVNQQPSAWAGSSCASALIDRLSVLVFYLRFRPRCLTWQCKRTRKCTHSGTLRGSSPHLHLERRRALGFTGEAAPPVAFCSQGPREESKKAGERSAWGSAGVNADAEVGGRALRNFRNILWGWPPGVAALKAGKD